MARALLALVFALIGSLPAAADESMFTIAIRDHQFVPDQITAPAQSRFQIIVTNNQQTAAEFESTSLHREKIVPAGGQISVFLGPLPPGDYEFFDDFHAATRGHLIIK